MLHLLTHIGGSYAVGNLLHVAERGHCICVYRDAEALFYEALQPHHVQRVEGHVSLQMVAGLYDNLLLLLYIFLQCEELFRQSLRVLLLLRRVVSLPLTLAQLLQLEPLQLVELRPRQFAAIYKDVHQLLVVAHCQVVWLYHLALQRFLHFLVRQSPRPCLLRNDDASQHIAVLHHGRFLHFVVVFLYLVFYLAWLNVLSVRQDYDFL